MNRIAPRGFTLLWAAPEFRVGMESSEFPAADCYSLGFLIWKIMINGTNPLLRYLGQNFGPAELLRAKKNPALLKRACEEIRNEVLGERVSNVIGALEATLQVNPRLRSIRQTADSLQRLDYIYEYNVMSITEHVRCCQLTGRALLSPLRFVESPVQKDLDRTKQVFPSL
jgi:hypothetical protein